MNPLQPTTTEAIEFLMHLFKQGHSHGQISTARSALSVIRILYRKRNLSNTATDLIINSWREGTRSQYKLYLINGVSIAKKGK